MVSYHRVPYSYGINLTSKNQVKVTMEVIHSVDIDETTMIKTSKKPTKVIKNISKLSLVNIKYIQGTPIGIDHS